MIGIHYITPTNSRKTGHQLCNIVTIFRKCRYKGLRRGTNIFMVGLNRKTAKLCFVRLFLSNSTLVHSNLFKKHSLVSAC